jgi:hypothetical protein
VTVWTVTTVRRNRNTRTVAVCDSLRNAEELVLANAGDIYEEGYYPFAVVEEIDTNYVYPNIPSEQWYQWKDEGYAKCDKPQDWQNIVSWGIG